MSELVNNSAVLLGAFENGSDAWHDARANGIGGSEISAIVGLNPWASRFSVYYQKKDRLRPVEESPAMMWGTLLEPVIFEEYRAHHLRPGHHMTTGQTFHHKDHPWWIVNPDGLIWDRDGRLVEILEIKTAGNEEKWGPDGTDLIPIYYRCQLAWYCGAMGVRKATLRALISGNDARTYRVTITDEDIEFLREHGEVFMHDLRNDIEPNLDDHMATYSAIKEMHPLIDGSVVQIPSALADRWWSAADELEAAKAKFNGVRNELAAQMGLARMAMCGDEKIAYRQRPRGGGDPFVKSAVRPKFQTVIAA